MDCFSVHTDLKIGVAKAVVLYTTASSMTRLHIIYASVSGHTEYVVEVLEKLLKEKRNVSVEKQRAEQSEVEDLLRGDVLLLACGTWNTGGIEGQLSPFMHTLLKEKATNIDLQRKNVAFISLGDSRYYFTTRCTEHFQQFRKEHNGQQLLSPLIILNEPYGQEERVIQWGEKLLRCVNLPSSYAVR